MQAYHGSRIVIAIGIGALTLFIGVYAARLVTVQKYAASRTVSQSPGLVADGQDKTTIIVSTPNTSDCRRYQLNLATGTRSEHGPSNCADGNQSGRLETISKSFRNR